MSQNNQEQQNPPNVPLSARRSERIAAKKPEVCSSKQHTALHRYANEQQCVRWCTLDDAEGDCTNVINANQDANQQQTLNDKNQTDDFKKWSKELQSTPIEKDYNKLKIINKPKIDKAD